MSTKKEMLGKENRKENGHRRYSLLLLALLFIGFASYGTYAYFTSSTSTTRGKLTLNGLDSSYNVDKDDIDNQNTGDGTTNKDTDNKYEYNPDPDDNGQGDGNGEFVEVTGDNAENSTKFGEFPWVYVGNNGAVDVDSSELLNQSFGLKEFNSYITSNEDNTEFGNVVVGEVFGNVVEGDVFRKTVRLAVNGKSKVPVTAQLIWAGVKDDDINNITAAAYVYVADQTSDKKAQPFVTTNVNTNFKKYIDIKSDELTKEIGQVKAGQYIDVELVAAVNKGTGVEEGTGTTKDESVTKTATVQLAKIARQLSIHLEQQTDDVVKLKTQTVENK